MVSCSKFWGNLEGIWGNPGEIPQFGWEIPGVYRDNRMIARDSTRNWRYYIENMTQLEMSHIQE